jgi:hypothetical protein
MTITCAAADASPLILRKLPFQPDSLRFRVNVERLTEVDAWGRLIIPGGIYDCCASGEPRVGTYK